MDIHLVSFISRPTSLPALFMEMGVRRQRKRKQLCKVTSCESVNIHEL